MLDTIDALNTTTSEDDLDVEGDEDRHPDDEPETDHEFVRVLRGDDDEICGETVQTWMWSGDPLSATFDSAQDAMTAADNFHGTALEWWEEEPSAWFANRPFPFPPECWRDPDINDNDPYTLTRSH